MFYQSQSKKTIHDHVIVDLETAEDIGSFWSWDRKSQFQGGLRRGGEVQKTSQFGMDQRRRCWSAKEEEKTNSFMEIVCEEVAFVEILRRQAVKFREEVWSSLFLTWVVATDENTLIQIYWQSIFYSAKY